MKGEPVHRGLGALLLLVTVLASATPGVAATVTGERAKWHALQLDFRGPWASERDTAPNPFLDYRLTVALTSPSGRQVRVPGFFAGDGQGNGLGDVWRARFSADEAGVWQYQASLRQGEAVAIALDEQVGIALPLPDASGEFTIAETRSDAPGFLRYGRLEYVGEHYLKFRDGPWWIKGGTNSPENLLGYSGIDGTADHGGDGWFLHDFAAHRGDWREGDPLFSNADTGADSRGLIGALNYLGAQGVNSVYFLPMNLGGDGQDTYPFIAATRDRFSKTHYDISKLHQWNQVLAHAQRQGIALNIVLSETEIGNERWLDDGALDVERKLFFRELVARFAYLLAVKWNLGEESDWPLTALQAQANYLQALDWSGKPLAVHNHLNDYYRYGELLGDARFSASSIQYDPWTAGDTVERWRARTRDAGQAWVLDMDENTDGLAAADIDQRRREILYDVYFSGGNIEWYYGANPLPAGGDITAGDFRLREVVWRQMRLAREMMQTELPFWRMQPADALLSGGSDAFGGGEVFAVQGEVYAIYLPETIGTETLDLPTDEGAYRQRWFDPRTGQTSAATSARVDGGRVVLGTPPSRTGDDWVVLLHRSDRVLANDTNRHAPRFADAEDVTVAPGSLFSISVQAIDEDGPFPSVTVGTVPPGMQVQSVGQGQLELVWAVPTDRTGEALVELIAIDAMDSAQQVSRTITLYIADPTPDTTGAVSGAAADAVAGGTTEHATEEATEEATGETAWVSIEPLTPRSISAGERLAVRVDPRSGTGRVPNLIAVSLPATARFDDNGDGTRTLYWETTADDIGDYRFEFVASDPVHPSLTATRSVTVSVMP